MVKTKKLSANQAAFNKMMDAHEKSGANAHVIEKIVDLVSDLFPPKKEISKLEEPKPSPIPLEEPKPSPTPPEAEIKAREGISEVSPPLAVVEEKNVKRAQVLEIGLQLSSMPFEDRWAAERRAFSKRLR